MPETMDRQETHEAKRREYDDLLALVLRMGAWLTGETSQMLPRETWNEQFTRYREQLQRLRDLGDELRPVSLRPSVAPMAGDALVEDVHSLFGLPATANDKG